MAPEGSYHVSKAQLFDIFMCGLAPVVRKPRISTLNVANMTYIMVTTLKTEPRIEQITSAIAYLY